MQRMIILGALFMFTGVALGAFGAHALKPVLILNQMSDIWQTAVDYHLWHGVSLLALAAIYGRNHQPLYLWAAWLITLGIILFSGSLYVLAITGIKFIGIITPIGGVSFLIAWGLVIWTAVTH